MNFALVTGGSRGLGAAICRHLAAQGLGIIINYHSNETAAQEVAETIRKIGGVADLLPFDVSNEQAVDSALEKWEETPLRPHNRACQQRRHPRRQSAHIHADRPMAQGD